MKMNHYGKKIEQRRHDNEREDDEQDGKHLEAISLPQVKLVVDIDDDENKNK